MTRPILLPSPFRVIEFDEIASTSDEAKRLAAEGAEAGTLVIARRQTAGRGRQGRAWDSPPGNLYFSVVLRPDCSATQAAELSLVAAVALGSSLTGFLEGKHAVQLKWPNDILVRNAKLGGILVESELRRDGQVDYLVLGIGLNLAAAPPPEATRYPAISLAEIGVVLTPATILPKLIATLEVWIGRWQRDGFEPIREAWLERAYGLGEIVRSGDKAEADGVFVDLSPAGALVLEREGAHIEVAGGEWIFPSLLPDPSASR